MSATPAPSPARAAPALAAFALLVAVVAVAWVLGLFGSGSYTVRARTQSAGLIVKGNSVRIAGRTVGKVTGLRVTPDSLAEIELALDDDVAPLREGTQAQVRLSSLSSPAGRYIDLRIPPAGGDEIPDGGVIPLQDTDALVDVDQFFNMFDERARRGLTRVIRGSGEQFRDAGERVERGWRYLDPALVASSQLFDELNRDSAALRRFLGESSQLVTALAGRREQLAQLVDRLATATGAIARVEGRLSDAIAQAPPFLRRANTTYVNLRQALDDLDPLVEASLPVAPRLDRLLRELQPFAREAGPTVRDLSRAVRAPGEFNDLTELAELTPDLRDVAVGTAVRNGERRRGSLAETAAALRNLRPQIAFWRPYAGDITGFFKALGNVGIYDANGVASRAATLPAAFEALPDGGLAVIPPALRQEQWDTVAVKQLNRCPGSAERPAEDGSNPWRPGPGFNCDPTQVPPGG